MTLDSLTVIIPTYNRAAVLKKALEAYNGQAEPQLIRELIVVDDGSTDDTPSVVRQAAEHNLFPIRYLHQANRGPAAARNYGIRETHSRLVLFTDSDIVPERDLVSQHIVWHRNNPDDSVAVLGYVTWPSDPKPTPFMSWCGEEGTLFAFGKFQPGQQLGPFDLYTCNVSLKTEFLKASGLFDEDFKGAAYEDTEIGYRLAKVGMRLLYNPHAKARHHQFFRFADICEKAAANRAAAAVFFQKEAGQRLIEIETARKRKWGYLYEIRRLAGRGAGALLSPARVLCDSQLPLPSIVYYLLFRYYVTRSGAQP